MDSTTLKGIVLRATPYRERSTIVHIYTTEQGVQSFLSWDVKSSKHKPKAKTMALFRPLQFIRFSTTKLHSRGMRTIAEVDLDFCYHNLFKHPIKRMLCFYFSELLLNTLKNELDDTDLYNFLKHTMQWLDQAEDAYANFHLWFSFQLTKFLGFFPNQESLDAPYLDLFSGKFTHQETIYSCNLTVSTHIKQLLSTDLEQIAFPLSRVDRKQILSSCLQYYDLHGFSLKPIKSLSILEEVIFI